MVIDKKKKRGKIMKKLVAIALCLTFVLGGCSTATTNEESSTETSTATTTETSTEASSETTTEASGEKQQLIISTWGLSEDVLHEDVYGPFEEAFNCEVVLETGSTSERYTKLLNDPNSTIDVIELSQSAAANGYDANLFEKIDYSKIPNAEQLIPAAQQLTESGYGPAYTVNSVGIIYDKEAVGFEITSFADLWNSELEGMVAIPDITTTFGPAMVAIASDYKEVDITTDNGTAAFEALKELKPNILKTYTKSSDLANMFASGEITVAVVGNFAVPMIQEAAPNVAYVTPEGTYANFNTIDINVNSENKDLAYEYINWRLSSELQASTATTLNEAPTNSTVTLTDEIAKDMTYGEIATSAKAIDYSFVNPILEDWINQWNLTINN
jgi:putative spermidine/putrescine transport system substrate-binding protein